MTAYNLCAECGQRRGGLIHRPWRDQGHRFVDPRSVAVPPPIKTYTRAQAIREGFREVDSWPAEGFSPKVGDRAIVYARGDLRLGLVSKIGRTTLYVDVATPTSPLLVTKGVIGGRWTQRGWLKPDDTEPAPCHLPKWRNADGECEHPDHDEIAREGRAMAQGGLI